MHKNQLFLFLPYLAAAVILLLLFILIKKLLEAKRYPYHARPILTKREYQFYLLLRQETDRRGLLICPKVGLKDLMAVSCKGSYLKYFRLIAQKHVDFVICDRNLNILFALELDDSSHDTKEARRRDRFKDRAFRAAQIPLKRIRDYDQKTIQSLFRGCILP